MIEGLNQEAQLRYKVLLEGVSAVRRDLGDLQEDLGRDTPKAVRELDKALGSLEGSFRKVGTAGKEAGRETVAPLNAIADAAKRARAEVEKANTALTGARLGAVTGEKLEGSRPLSAISEAEKTRLVGLDDAASTSIVAQIRKERAERAQIAREAEAQAKREAAARAQLAREVVAGEDRMAAAIAKRAQAERAAARDNSRRENSIADAEWTRQLKEAEASLDVQRRASTDSLITERYALYDVATTAGITGAALLALAVAYEMVAVNRERAFADVRRTAGFNEATGGIDQLNGTDGSTNVRGMLRDLTRSIPENFTTLAGTATVGGQLGLNAEELERYTTSITKFSTVSGLTAEDSGMRLGKLNNILGLTSSGYDMLTRSIAFAGAESAATEDQIIAVAAEIAPYSRQAGLAATETIGLATALASLQIAPERARSAMQDMFRSIDGAVATGGEKLRNYAAISNMSAEEFAAGWKSAPAETFQAFTSGFASVENATLALRALGLDGQRVAPTLLSLANNTELVAASFEDAKNGVTNGFLDEAFAITVATVAEQFQLLVNEVANLADALGSPGLAAISGLILGIKNIIAGATELASSPLGQFFAPLATGILAAAGALLVLVGGAAAAGASMLAIRTAIMGLNGHLPPFLANLINARLGFMGIELEARKATTTLVATGTGAQVAGAGMATASAGARALRVALTGLLASTGIGLLLTLVGNLGAEAINASISQDTMADSIDSANDSIDLQTGLLLQDAGALREAVAAANEFANANSNLEGSLFDLGQSIQKNGTAFDAYSTGGRSNMRALSTTISALTESAGGDAQILANLLLGLEQQLVSAGAGADAIQMVRRAMEATGTAASEATVTSTSLAVGLDHVDQSARNASGGLAALEKQVRTVSDYSSDLSTLFSSATNFRFGSNAAYDSILSRYSQMRSEAKTAAESIEELRNKIRESEAEMRGIQGSRAGLEYGMSIAMQYGDTIRTAQLAGEIAQLNAKEGTEKSNLTNLNQQLAEQQEALNRSLVGNSDAAIANRESVRQLVAAYQEYLVELANSGLSQDELAIKSAELRTEFESQLTQMGFSASEVRDNFSPAFQSFSDIITKFPRNVTLEANPDPAQRAIDEFLAKNAQNTIDVSVQADRGAVAQHFTDIGNTAAESLSAAFSSPRQSSGYKNTRSSPTLWDQIVSAIFRGQGAGEGIRLSGSGSLGFSDGGFTGYGAKDEYAGAVHKGEYVFPQEAVRYYGRDNLAHAHRVAMRDYSSGGLAGAAPGVFGGGFAGSGGGVVDVRIVDVTQAAAEQLGTANGAHPVLLVADGQAVARVVSTANATYTRGS